MQQKRNSGNNSTLLLLFAKSYFSLSFHFIIDYLLLKCNIYIAITIYILHFRK